MPRTTVFAFALLVTAASTAVLAQIRYLPDAPGTWKPWKFIAYADNRRLLAAPPLEVKALEKQLLALNAILKSTPGFASPVGFSVETVGDMQLLDAGPAGAAGQPAMAKRPLPAMLNFGAYGVYETAAGVRGDAGETAQLLFFVNQLALPLFSSGDNNVPEFENVEADVVLLAKPQPDLFGMPRYDDTLVLKKNPAPIWAAVPLGEAMDLAIRGIQARLAGRRDVAARLQTQYDDIKDPAKRAKRIADAAKNVAAVERELATAQAAAAAVPALDRAAPACYASQDRVSRFKRAPADGGDGPKPIHAGGCAANKRLLESIDRQALLAWLQ
jgi:hypothetical protein